MTAKVSQKFKIEEEIGRTGLAQWYGMVEERFVKDLYGKDGITKFDEMRRRDPTIRSLLYATKLMARTSQWKAVAASDKPGPDQEAAEFLQSCLEDMSHTVIDAIDDALSMLPFGWFWQEICYKRRLGATGKHASQFDDGKIGWRKWAPRKQSSWQKWEFDEAGGLAGMWQWPQPQRGGEHIFLPIEKSLHYVTESDCGNPEGISLNESIYETWYFLKNLLPLLGIGFERSFVGLPYFKWREGVKPDPEDRAAVEAMGKGLRMGEKAFASIPSSIEEFDLKSVANPVAGDILATIKYMRALILQTALADYINLGVSETGSWALGRDKSQLFLMATNGWLDKIAAVLNRFAVPRLFGYNEFASITAYPQIDHTMIEKPDLEELGQFIERIGPYIPLADEDMIWLRHRAGMPEIAQPSEAPGPETGEEEEAEASGLGRALAEFAEAPESGTLEAIAGQALSERRGVLQEALAAKQADPGDAFWTAEEKALTQAMLPGIEQMALEGARAAAAEMEVLGIVVDWTLVNTAASEWARTYTFSLVKGITETSKTALQTQLSNWIEAGEPLPELFKRLDPVYGPVRAEMIGVTEATRAYAEGNTLVWEKSEVIEARQWQTAADELVCPICAPLQGQVAKLGEPFPGGIMNPPAHVRCRCWVTPVIIKAKK